MHSMKCGVCLLGHRTFPNNVTWRQIQQRPWGGSGGDGVGYIAVSLQLGLEGRVRTVR